MSGYHRFLLTVQPEIIIYASQLYTCIFYLGDHYFFNGLIGCLDNLSYYSCLIQPIKF